MIDIEELKKINSSMTGGQWSAEWDQQLHPVCTIYAGADQQHHGLNLFGRMNPDWNGKANVAGVCYLRNNLTDIVAEIEALRAQVTVLKGARG
jgi:hypothetical protein